MAANNPIDIVNAALAKGEIEKLLLGTPEYSYRSRLSPALGNTDLTELMAVIYDGLDPQSKEAAKDALVKGLSSLSETYEGVEAVATCILLESLRRSNGRPLLGLPIDYLAKRLQVTIRAFEPRLRADKGGAGRDWPDGLLGDLRRLSRITENLGGPSFCE